MKQSTINKLAIGAIAVGIGAVLLKSAKAAGNGLVVVERTITPTTCSGACTVNGSIKWRNDSTEPVVFTPSISVNGVVESIGTELTVQPGAETPLIEFSKAITATTDFCPVPNN